jgi:hypothetical protein
LNDEALGILLNLQCTRAAVHNRNSIDISFMALTLLLNLLLASMIAGKLMIARRYVRALSDRISASQYTSIIGIVVESALAWVLSIVFNLASSLCSPSSYFGALWPFFNTIFQIMSVSDTPIS